MSNPHVLGRTITDRELTALIGLPPAPYSIKRDHPRFDQALAAIEDPQIALDDLVALFAPADAYERALADAEATEIIGGVLYFRGEEVHSHLADRLADVFNLGLDPDPWEALTFNIYANPDPWVRDDLIEWLERSGMPQSPDGCFYAWKYVDGEYRSLHADTDGTRYDHTPGNVVEMDRERCDTNRNNTCSTGLHFCSIDYLPSTPVGQKIVLVKVDPRDVTSIPREYGLQKGRCCRYEVVADVTENYRELIFDAVEDIEPEPEVSTTLVVKSGVLGEITPERFALLVEELGSQAALAKAYNLSAGTVAAWKRKLFPNNGGVE